MEGIKYVQIIPVVTEMQGVENSDLGVPENTIRRKCLTGQNFDEFDESKLHHQNFPHQYFTFQ